MIKEILEYQTKDFEKIKIERKIDSDDDKKVFNKMLDLVKDAQSKSNKLESYAQSIYNDYEALKKTYEENSAVATKFNKNDINSISEEELNMAQNLSNSISSNLSILEKKILGCAEKINNILSEFEVAKKNYNSAKEKYQLHKENHEKKKAVVAPQIKKIDDELAVLAKKIEPKLLEKYQHKRADRIFPIFVPLQGDSCGGCFTQIPTARLENIKDNGYIECENCRRIIFFSDYKK
ncbi:MAG: C4-type zinc ribbon domain-containing protein [Clostridia bacterium]